MTAKPKRPHPTDTQYNFPTEESPYTIMRYGDGWAVYSRASDRMIPGMDEHPLELPTAESCENLLRYMMIRTGPVSLM